MKRSVFLAALTTLAAGSALAQSNITVYGRLSQTIENQKVGATTRGVVVDNDSRIGFKGSEDLGSGLRAFFLIESGFQADSGTVAGAFWGRESNLGVQHNDFGTLRIGNMGRTAGYFTVVDSVSLHNHDSGTSKDALYLSPGASTNTLAYTSPSLGGVVIEAQYGVGEGLAAHTTVLAGTYTFAGVQLGASYIKGDVASFAAAGVPVAAYRGDEYGLRALYTTGPLTLGGYYIHNRAEAPGAKVERNSLRFAAAYALGEGEIHANLGWAGKADLNGTSVNDTDAKQFTVAYNHNLSKRTKLYGLFTRTFNGNAASYGYPEVGAVAPGQDVRALGVGIRHNF